MAFDGAVANGPAQVVVVVVGKLAFHLKLLKTLPLRWM